MGQTLRFGRQHPDKGRDTEIKRMDQARAVPVEHLADVDPGGFYREDKAEIRSFDLSIG